MKAQLFRVFHCCLQGISTERTVLSTVLQLSRNAYPATPLPFGIADISNPYNIQHSCCLLLSLINEELSGKGCQSFYVGFIVFLCFYTVSVGARGLPKPLSRAIAVVDAFCSRFAFGAPGVSWWVFHYPRVLIATNRSLDSSSYVLLSDPPPRHSSRTGSC
jgi:hypothetical protein